MTLLEPAQVWRKVLTEVLVAHGKIQVLRQGGGRAVVAVPEAEDHALVELEQVVADQLLDEVARHQPATPVQ